DRRLCERACVQLVDRRVADGTAQHAVLADAPHERARVHVRDRDDALSAQPRRPLGPSDVHHDRLRLHPLGLRARRIDAVVADERVGEAQHLGDVARVGRRLLVARARGREAGLPGRDAGRADGGAGEDGAVLEDDCGGALHSQLHLMRLFAYYANTMPTTAILGASGYAGQETLDRVLAHPEFDVVALGSDSLAGAPASALDPRLNGSLPPFVPNEEAAAAGADVLFLCLGNERAAAFEPPGGAVVVDLSGAHRLEAALYPEWYGFEHPRPGAWEYGIPELWPPAGRLIANPGCYATAAILALAPIRDAIDEAGVVVDAKSGVSGAGRELKESSHAGFVLENLSPYKVGRHQH